MHGLPPEIRFEIERASAGNFLFCPAAHLLVDQSPVPQLYEEAAQLLRLLLSAGLKLRDGTDEYHFTIASMARVLDAAIRHSISHSDCADHMLYRLHGHPAVVAPNRLRSKHHAMIGTFCANLPADLRRSVAKSQFWGALDAACAHIPGVERTQK